MATTDIERLVVSLEASITKYDRTMQKAVGVTNSSMKKIERRNATMVRRIENSFSGLQRGLATAFASAAALRGAQQLIDASTRIENSLKVVGLAGEELEHVYDQLFASAQRNMAPLETLTTLYSRLGLAQKELGVTNDQLISFTDNVALALRVQGTNAQEARGALIQLSQAMGSGIVRAEEFNSVVEGAPSILRAAATGLVEAEGSVAKLRALVVDGKVSSQAFFQAFQAGAGILKDQVAGAEVTVSQAFVRLQNVLIDVAGKFNEGTAASEIMAAGLSNLADGAENFGTWLSENGDGVQAFFSDVATAVQAAQDAARKAGQETGLSGFGRFVEDLTGLKVSSDYATGAVKKTADQIERLTGGATEADLAIADAEQALATFALNSAGRFGELQPVVDDFIQQLLDGRGTAESAAEAIDAIGQAGDFGSLITDLGGLVTALLQVRGEAVATAAAVAAARRGENAQSNIAGQRAEQLANRPAPAVKPVSLSDYPITSAGTGGGGNSTADRFADALQAQEQRINEMNREIELRRKLGPTLDGNAAAVESLRVQMELENEAAKAGLELTPERRRRIMELADGYAAATAELEHMENAADAAEQAARTLQEGLIEAFSDGKVEASELLGIVTDLMKQLLSNNGGGLFGLLQGLGGGFGSIAGGAAIPSGGFVPGLTGPKLFAQGGIAKTASIFGEAGPEAAVPLPDGRRIPVDLRMPRAPSQQVVVKPETHIHPPQGFESYTEESEGGMRRDVFFRRAVAKAISQPGPAQKAVQSTGQLVRR